MIPYSSSPWSEAVSNDPISVPIHSFKTLNMFTLFE